MTREKCNADRFPEIDCVRASLSSGVVRAAEDGATRLGVGADRVLIARGALDEEGYLRCLAADLGVTFDTLDATPRSLCPISDDRLIEAAGMGLLPLKIDGEPCLVVAPRGTAARQIFTMVSRRPMLATRIRLTSAERLNRFVLRYASRALTAQASNDLKRTWPALSAAPPRWRVNSIPLATAALFLLVAFICAPRIAAHSAELILVAVFSAWLALRLYSILIFFRPAPAGALPARELPTYTVMAALYKEAASVNGLLHAIERLDYPPEKLDIVIAVEADDRATRHALATRKNLIPITIVPVAVAEPRTKPKALNFALPFARGTFIVIYDAEDRPQPDQLRQALQAFRDGDDRLACVQAPLCIDNTADSWLTRGIMAQTPQAIS